MKNQISNKKNLIYLNNSDGIKKQKSGSKKSDDLKQQKLSKSVIETYS